MLIILFKIFTIVLGIVFYVRGFELIKNKKLTLKRGFVLIAHLSFGGGLVVHGIYPIIINHPFVYVLANTLSGIGFMLFAFIPCGTPVFNKQPLKLMRDIILFFIGLTMLLMTF